MTTSDLTSSRRFFVGVDGGGSSTRAIIAAEDGSVWGRGTALSCNPHERGIPQAVAELKRALSEAWLNLGAKAQPLAGAFFGIAGTASLSNDQRNELTTWIPRTAEACIEVDHDIRIALAGGLSGRPGIAIIAGTGSSGYGRTADGRTARAGGWGALLDDLGGGYWMAIKALTAVIKASDGRGPSTDLNALVLSSLELEREQDFLPWLRRLEVGRPEIARLAPLVFNAATEGDKVSQSIISEGARELAAIAAAIGTKLFPADVTEVILAGGLSCHRDYVTAVSRAIANASPLLELKTPEHSPTAGALLLAFQQKGLSVPQTILKAIASSN